MKQHTAHQYLDSLNTHHQALNELLQTLKTASTSMLVTDDEFKNLRNTYENISHAENHTRINYYYEQAEGDLVSMHQRHQETLIEQQIRDGHKQVRDLLGIIRPNTSPQANTVHSNVSHYVSELSENELNTKVLDAHVFYRMIYDKVANGEYSHQQFKQLFNEISENLGKNPMTVSSIIDFYKKNDIAQPTDEDFRLLIRNEHKNYTNTAVSVRQMHPDDYVKGTLTTEISLQKMAIETDKRTDLLQDADSFYKLIYKKMALREYSAAEFNKLYVHISEKLVHSPLLKNDIIEFYAQQNIKQLTEEEWDTLFNRQETRKLPEHITAQTADLDFQGTVQIVDEQGFKLNTDLYYNTESNDQASHEYLDILANTLLDTANCFNKFFGIRKLDQANNFRLFIFDSKEDYLTYFPQATGHATASDNGNVCNLYIFKGKNNYSNVSDLLHHEFAHALTFQSTAKLGLSTTLMEGIAEFLVHKMNGKSNVDFINLIPQENYKRSIREIVSNPLNRSDPYLTGAAIVAFLEETNPNFIENLLYAAQEASKNDQHIKVYEMMHNLFDKYEQQSLLEIPWFKQYLSTQQPNEPIHSRLRRASDISAELTLSPPSNIQPSKQTGTPQTPAESKIISVDYFQIKELYETVSESEKFSVRSLWDKLHQAEYNLNALQTSLTDAEYQHLDFLQSMARAQPISEDVIAVAITAGDDTSNSDLSQQTIQPDKLVETMAAMTSTDQTSAYSDRSISTSFDSVSNMTHNLRLPVAQTHPDFS